MLPWQSRALESTSGTLCSNGVQKHDPHALGYFGRLPGELRNKIYRCAVVEVTPIRLHAQPTKDNVGLVFAPPPLARVHPQIRDEMLPIYFTENTFNSVADASIVIPSSDDYGVNRWARDWMEIFQNCNTDLKFIRIKSGFRAGGGYVEIRIRRVPDVTDVTMDMSWARRCLLIEGGRLVPLIVIESWDGPDPDGWIRTRADVQD